MQAISLTSLYADDTNLSSSLKILIKDSKRKISIETVINNELSKR